jgi:hypothetical protein
VETQNPLSQWIASSHLEGRAVAEMAQTLLNGQFAVIDGFLNDTAADRVGEFLEKEVSFDEVVNVAAPGRRVSDEEWETIAYPDKIERTRVCPVVLPQFRVTANTAAFLRLRTALRSAEMNRFMSSLCGENVAGLRDAIGYARKMVRGDFIREHDDESDARAAALILHFSRDWQPQDGGALRIKRSQGDYLEISTGWNRAVIMKVDGIMTHSVTDITGSAPRFTIQNWFVKA